MKNLLSWKLGRNAKKINFLVTILKINYCRGLSNQFAALTKVKLSHFSLDLPYRVARQCCKLYELRLLLYPPSKYLCSKINDSLASPGCSGPWVKQLHCYSEGHTHFGGTNGGLKRGDLQPLNPLYPTWGQWQPSRGHDRVKTSGGYGFKPCEVINSLDQLVTKRQSGKPFVATCWLIPQYHAFLLKNLAFKSENRHQHIEFDNKWGP